MNKNERNKFAVEIIPRRDQIRFAPRDEPPALGRGKPHRQNAAAEEAVGTRAGGSPEMRANRNSSITPDPASITEESGKLSSPKSGIAWRWWRARRRRQRGTATSMVLVIL
ncbi:hypothetical protein TNCV_2641551 [Trichonephila clavipes]|nr:hypothetical protein TNCV_2641551 [Trichonephila clavipes]